MQKFLFTVILLLGVKCSLFSQSDFRPGYVITHSMDTIYGLLDYRGEVRNMKVCSFKDDEKGTITEFHAKDIYGYRFDQGKFYISKQINNDKISDTVFVEFLLKGIRDLYYYKNGNYTVYFIDAGDGTLIELENDEINYERDGRDFVRESNRYIGILTYAFKDCPELKDDINETRLTHKSLINITRKYHDYKCDDEVCIIYEKELPVFTVEIEPSIGLSMTSLSFDNTAYFEEMELSASHSAQIGVTFNMKMPRFNEKLSLALSGLMNKDYFYGTTSKEYITYKITNSYCHVHTLNLFTQLQLRYTYPKGKVRPELFAGGFINYMLDNEVKYQEEVVINGSVTTTVTQLYLLQNTYKGLMGGIGLRYQLFNSVRVFNRLRYYYYVNNYKYEVETSLNSFSVSMGLIF